MVVLIVVVDDDVVVVVIILTIVVPVASGISLDLEYYKNLQSCSQPVEVLMKT